MSIEYEKENRHPGRPGALGYHLALLGSIRAEPSSEGPAAALPRREHRPQRLGCASQRRSWRRLRHSGCFPGKRAMDSTGLLLWPYDWNIAMRIEIEQEDDGRWLTEIPELPGVMVYGTSREEAVARVKALALRVLADRLEHGETIPELREVFSVAA